MSSCDDEYTSFGEGGWWWECSVHGSNGPFPTWEQARADHDGETAP